jgi:Mn-dependent DtxR family transcriptional regulator
LYQNGLYSNIIRWEYGGFHVREGFLMPTPSMEDYIEQIYILIEEKGYARVSDIAENLSVHPSSVTKMVQKLDKDEYLVYEKYRGLSLTPKGKKIGKRLVYRHELLEQFLRVIGVEEEHIYRDVEGIEHHLSWESIDRIGDLVQFFQENDNRVQELREVQKKNEEQQDE